MPTSRRQVLITISQLATAATLVSCGSSADRNAAAGNSDLEFLASVAYDILPFAELTPALYVKAAQQVLDLQDANVPDGLKQLRDASHGTAWKDVAEADRIAILTAMQDNPFFAVLHANTLQVLLRDPETFAVVGYGGSTIEYGGYINRGFNDINWLPAGKNN